MPPLTIMTWMRDCDLEDFSNAWPEALKVWGKSGPLEEYVHIINAAKEPTAPEMAARADAFLLTGGEDIGPEFHVGPLSSTELQQIESPNLDRDRWEFAALPTALAANIPILAICRGVQVLNVALGGTLHCHIEGHRDTPRRYENRQPLRHASGVPRTFEAVNTAHHQTLNRVAPGLQVESWYKGDETIEQVRGTPGAAVETRSGGFHLPQYVFGTQYHPERHAIYAPVFAEFLQAAADRRRLSAA